MYENFLSPIWYKIFATIFQCALLTFLVDLEGPGNFLKNAERRDNSFDLIKWLSDYSEWILSEALDILYAM